MHSMPSMQLAPNSGTIITQSLDNQVGMPAWPHRASLTGCVVNRGRLEASRPRASRGASPDARVPRRHSDSHAQGMPGTPLLISRTPVFIPAHSQANPLHTQLHARRQVMSYTVSRDRFKQNRKKTFKGHNTAGYACQVGRAAGRPATAPKAAAGGAGDARCPSLPAPGFRLLLNHALAAAPPPHTAPRPGVQVNWAPPLVHMLSTCLSPPS